MKHTLRAGPWTASGSQAEPPSLPGPYVSVSSVLGSGQARWGAETLEAPVAAGRLQGWALSAGASACVLPLLASCRVQVLITSTSAGQPVGGRLRSGASGTDERAHGHVCGQERRDRGWPLRL